MAYIPGTIPEAMTEALRNVQNVAPGTFPLIWNTTAGRLEIWDGDEWKGSSSSTASEWQFSTTTAAADPGTGSMRYNSGTPASVTEIYISQINIDGTDMTVVLNGLAMGTEVYFQESTTAANFILGVLDINPVDNGTWWTLQLTISDSGAFVPTNNRSTTGVFTQTAAALLAQIEGEVETSGTTLRQDIFDLFPFGCIATVGGSTAETLTDATFRQLTGWNTDGKFNGMVADHTDDAIKAVSAGDYWVVAMMSFEDGTNKNYEIEIYLFDDSASSFVGQAFLDQATVNSGGDPNRLAVSGIVTMDVDDKIAIFHRSSDGGTSFTMLESSLFVRKLND